MSRRRGILLAMAVVVASILVTVVLLSPVKGNPDRGILPPIDQPAPAEPK